MCNVSNTRVRYENAAIFILLKSCIYSTLSLCVSLILVSYYSTLISDSFASLLEHSSFHLQESYSGDCIFLPFINEENTMLKCSDKDLPELVIR